MGGARAVAEARQLRIEDELRDALAVAQVDEHAAAMVAVARDPAEEDDGLARVGGTELVGVVRAFQLVDESGHSPAQCSISPVDSTTKVSRLSSTLAACAAAAIAPAFLAASHAANVADAAHDRGVARALAFDPQPWRSLDVLVGVLLAPLPLGTRAFRAALGGALVLACAGAALFAIARALLTACARTTRLGAFVALLAAVTPLVAAPWQIEGAAVGGSALGALLVLSPVAVLAAGLDARWAALALGLALGHEPLAGVCALAGCAALVAADPALRATLVPRADLPLALRALLPWALAGLLPFALAVARTHASGAPLLAALAEGWAGERGASPPGGPGAFVDREWGPIFGLLVVAGAALAALVPAARALAGALAAIALGGLACAWLGAPVGPTRFGAPVLAAFGAASVLGGVAMQAAARAVAGARVPMARASAAMILVLEAALPADLADDALTRTAPRAAGAAAAWDDAAWGALAPKTVLLVGAPSIYARALAARAGATLRDDVTLVPTFAHDARAWRAMSGDPALVPLWRELELAGAPSESALSSVASARPLAMAYDARWATTWETGRSEGKALGKHLVPLALFDEVEPEPRGASDRRRALDASQPARDRLARVVRGDPELEAAAHALLRARADLAASLPSEADVAARTAADAQAFAAGD